MGQASQIEPTERELYERHQQYKRDMQPFIYQLNQIYAHMPLSGFKINLLDGSFEQLPPAKEWQDAIDRITNLRDEFIKNNYPEYCNEGA